MYPTPPLVMVTDVTLPDEIEAVAVAIVETPSVDPIVTVGDTVYPRPSLVIEILEIVPAIDTIAVPEAPTILSCDVFVIECWKSLT